MNKQLLYTVFLHLLKLYTSNIMFTIIKMVLNNCLLFIAFNKVIKLDQLCNLTDILAYIIEP